MRSGFIIKGMTSTGILEGYMDLYKPKPTKNTLEFSRLILTNKMTKKTKVSSENSLKPKLNSRKTERESTMTSMNS